MSENKPATQPADDPRGRLLLTIIFALVGGVIGGLIAANTDDLFWVWAVVAYIPLGALAGVLVGWGLLWVFVWWLGCQYGGIPSVGY